jgi:prepilin-type N-terminal cleavage/methylation domain-containing protein
MLVTVSTLFRNSRQTRTAGFTLIELAVVIFILALMLAGFLVPLATQVDQRNISDTQKTLEDIKEALVGFAMANGRLPRPAVSATNGTERAACVSDANCTGFIPWTALGVPKLDAWGKISHYSVTPAFADAPFTLTSSGSKTVRTRDSSGSLVNLATNVPAVVFSSGKNNWGTGDTGNLFADPSTTNADEDSNNAATTTFISRTITDNTVAPGGEFADVVTFLSVNILFNRMVAAGKLP